MQPLYGAHTKVITLQNSVDAYSYLSRQILDGFRGYHGPDPELEDYGVHCHPNVFPGLARVSAFVDEPGVVGVFPSFAGHDEPSLQIVFGYCPFQMDVSVAGAPSDGGPAGLTLQTVAQILSSVRGLEVVAEHVDVLPALWTKVAIAASCGSICSLTATPTSVITTVPHIGPIIEQVVYRRKASFDHVSRNGHLGAALFLTLSPVTNVDDLRNNVRGKALGGGPARGFRGDALQDNQDAVNQRRDLPISMVHAA